MSDNPYEPPASIQTGNPRAREVADAESPGLGGLIWTVLILDSIPCLWNLLILIGDVVGGHARYLLWNYPVEFFRHYGFWVGISGCGLSGNILILLKKRAGIPFAVAGIFLLIVAGGIALWELRNDHRNFSFLVTILVDVGWSVFYGIVVWMAARKLGFIRRKRS
jgi:hypothetical protein